MDYRRLAEYYDRLAATTKRLEMTDILVELVKEAEADELAPVLLLTRGAIAAEFEGLEVGLADKLVIRALTFATGLSDADITASYRESGDLGDTAERALSRDAALASTGSRAAPTRQTTLFGIADADDAEAPAEVALTVLDVFAALHEIAAAHGPGSQDRKLALLQKLLLRSDGVAARYIVRTVNGKLRLGVADMTLLDALAIAFATKEDRGAIERAYNVSSDIARVADTLRRDGLQGLESIHLSVGVPVRAMLAERLPDAAAIIEKLGGSAAIEYKYDGLRVQAHVFPRVGDAPRRVELFSRRLENLTDQFPDVIAHLREAFQGEQAIVEGEVVAIDAGTGEMRPFQEVSQRRGRKHDLARMAEEVPVAMYLFDCLLTDGADVTERPLPERRAALEAAFTADDRVRFSRYELVDSPEALDRVFDEAMTEGAEGVMAKSVRDDSMYRAGARGWQWIKFKRDYQASAMNDTVDLVAVGAFAGRGRRKGWYGALLVAAYNVEEDTFETVCKLGTGFDDAELARMPEMFAKNVIDHKHPRVRSNMVADYWFEPVHVAEVLAFELTLSPTHTAAMGALKDGAGVALRFPRFTGKWRTDKSAEEATSSLELVEMFRSQSSRQVPVSDARALDDGE